MSYDFSIKLKQTLPLPKIQNLVATLPHVSNSRLKIGDAYYMEIDLESAEGNSDNIESVSFHIPYAFWDRAQVDFDIYYNTIQTLAQYLGERAYDLQLDLYLDSAEFEAGKKTLAQTAIALGQITYDNGLLHLQYAYEPKILTWNLKTMQYLGQTSTTEKQPNTFNTEATQGQYLVKADEVTKSIQVFDTTTQSLLGTISKTGKVSHLKFIGSELLLSCSYNKSIKLWDLNTLKCLKTFKGHLDYISDIKCLNERLLVSSSIGNSLLFWDMASAKCIATLLHSHYNTAWLVIDPSGNYDHSDNYKGRMQWDFGKQAYTPKKGLGLDTKGVWNYSLIPNTQGQKTPHLLAKILKDYLGVNT